MLQIKKWDSSIGLHYVNKIRICTEMERRLRYFEMEIEKVPDINIHNLEEVYEALKALDMIELAVS